MLVVPRLVSGEFVLHMKPIGQWDAVLFYPQVYIENKIYKRYGKAQNFFLILGKFIKNLLHLLTGLPYHIFDYLTHAFNNACKIISGADIMFPLNLNLSQLSRTLRHFILLNIYLLLFFFYTKNICKTTFLRL